VETLSQDYPDKPSRFIQHVGRLRKRPSELRRSQSFTRRRSPISQKIYRRNLYVAGAESGLTETGRPKRKGFPAKKVAEVEAADGQLSLPELLRCHVRYFTQGKVIGSRAFVEKVFEAHKETGGLKRLIGPRELKGGNWDGLMGMSDVRGVPVQPSG
jgi:hypothetical protein